MSSAPDTAGWHSYDFGGCHHTRTPCQERPCRVRAVTLVAFAGLIAAEVTPAAAGAPVAAGAPAAARPVFTCRVNGTRRGDVGPGLGGAALLQPFGVTNVDRQRVTTLAVRRDGDVVVARLTRTPSTGPRTDEMVLTPLPAGAAAVAAVVLAAPPEWPRRPAGWPSTQIARIPAAELGTWTGVLSATPAEGRAALFDGLVTARTRLRPAPLSAREQDALRHLAGGWHGTAEQLLTTATAVAAGATPDATATGTPT